MCFQERRILGGSQRVTRVHARERTPARANTAHGVRESIISAFHAPRFKKKANMPHGVYVYGYVYVCISVIAEILQFCTSMLHDNEGEAFPFRDQDTRFFALSPQRCTFQRWRATLGLFLALYNFPLVSRGASLYTGRLNGFPGILASSSHRERYIYVYTLIRIRPFSASFSILSSYTIHFAIIITSYGKSKSLLPTHFLLKQSISRSPLFVLPR